MGLSTIGSLQAPEYRLQRNDREPKRLASHEEWHEILRSGPPQTILGGIAKEAGQRMVVAWIGDERMAVSIPVSKARNGYLQSKLSAQDWAWLEDHL